MRQTKLLKFLFKKFWRVFFLLFLLTFLTSFLAFLVRFNLRNNLSFNADLRGKFDFLVGKISVVKEMNGGAVHVNWPKLLLLLFFCYFPIRIIVQFTLNYLQKYYCRVITVYLLKKMVAFAAKNKEVIVKKKVEKTFILNNLVPRFSQQFLELPVSLFGIFINIFLETFSLFFLIKSRSLSEITPLVVIFLLTNLLWYGIFNLTMKKFAQKSQKKQVILQNEEKTQIRLFLENLDFPEHRVKLEKLSQTFDNNSSSLNFLSFVSVLAKLTNLIIPGIAVFFLLLYCNFYSEGKEYIGWNEYLIAYNLQSLVSNFNKLFNTLSSISTFRKNYSQVESFYF